MNAITLLKNDHRTVEKLFVRFEKAGDKAFVEKGELIGRIVQELSVHAAIEEQVFYPYIRLNVEGVEDDTLEALEEHHIVKWVLSELEHMDAEDERYTAKATVLIENVRHHVEEEEGGLFPRVAKALNDRQLDEMGARLDRAKENAPKRPHPRSPDTPPGNLVTGPAAALADLATETVKGLARSAIERVTGGEEAVVEAASDTVDTVTETAAKARRAVTKTATKATRAAGDRAETAGKKAKKASRAATRTPSQATSKVSTTAKRASKKPSTTAKRVSKKATTKASATKRTATKKGPGATRKASAATRSSTAKRVTRPAKKAARAVKRTARAAR